MALVYNEDQTLLKESAVGFFKERSPITAFRSLRDKRDETGYDSDLWSEMAEMGFTSLLLSEEEGGTGFGYVGAGIVAEAMATTLVSSPFTASCVLATEILKSTGSAILERVSSGEAIATVALDETGHYSPESVKTKAIADGDGYKLSGMKTFVPEGHTADHIIVLARTDDDRLSLYTVQKGAANLITDRTVMADSRNWAKLTFEGTPATLLSDDGLEKLIPAIDKVNIVLAAELLGLTQAAFDMTTAYLKERKQFGKIIGTFQGLQHRSAHLFAEIEVTRSIILAALQAADASAPNLSMLASAAKAKACKTAELATNEGIQMHGGIGMTDEYDIGFFIKRARAVSNLYGGQNYHTDRFATLSGY
ncbi:acyl-CoA dehydrogenase family protein [Temperatibacter marinus]|uniref:Acyl-CoA dehydrogenase family protein n=1 Tax=Temperatibacter marinus TaxID=1456591 RepID=A0AA52H837_9PROT|nr:acyl-CoA dehydrogenase family protein [Temperatibacter marinus]WND01716.1 acyl-CoA dehydrogenase family protein [Temperatibacter marinus]